MKSLDREKVKSSFASYTDDYNSKDPKIKLKIDHTYRVAALCERIAMTVPGVDTDLSWLSGMLHDIGRFEQVKRYNTFKDSESVDHASFGADLLFKENLLSSFGDYENIEKDILEVAIRNHNKFIIDKDVPPEYQPYCNILRDADKIDILRVNIDTPPEEIYNVSTEELLRSEVTEAVKKGFLEGHAILRSERKTAADILVGHVSMIQELVYPESTLIVKEQGYIEKLLEFRSENEDTMKWFEVMKKTLRERGFLR
ncbi:MAG: HD domain-containing protein [Lachnospiraceae bacterium]|nr:HD domain-containing protein [Lachnospiraceae bacterium]